METSWHCHRGGAESDASMDSSIQNQLISVSKAAQQLIDGAPYPLAEYKGQDVGNLCGSAIIQ